MSSTSREEVSVGRDIADVVVVSWNQRELTVKCLEHLIDQSVRCRVVLVDNASSDGTVTEVRQRFPQVTVLVNESNIGFGKAVNRGVVATHNRAIVLVNNDLFVEPQFVERIVLPLTRPGIGMVAGTTVMPGNGPARIDSAGIQIDRALCIFNHSRHRPLADGLRGCPPIPSGGCVAYLREAFEQVGGFDELLFAYGEDADLGLRILSAGWQSAYAPTARGVHIGGASTGTSASPVRRRLSGTARGFLLRRYQLDRRGIIRVLLTEPFIVVADLVLNRTWDGVAGRWAGWHLAASRGRRLPVPPGVIDRSVGLVDSIRLRACQ